MRIKYRGYLLAADQSWDKPGYVIAAVFRVTDLVTVFEFYSSESPSKTIKELKEKIRTGQITNEPIPN